MWNFENLRTGHFSQGQNLWKNLLKNLWNKTCEKTYEKESCSGAFSHVFSQGLKSQNLWTGHFSRSHNLWKNLWKRLLFWSFFTVCTAAGHTRGQNLKTNEQDTFHMVPWTDYIVFINILAKFDGQYDMSLMSYIRSSDNWDMHRSPFMSFSLYIEIKK